MQGALWNPGPVRHHDGFSPIRFSPPKSAQKPDIIFFRFRNFSAHHPAHPPLGETPMVLMTWAKVAQGNAGKNAESKRPQSSLYQVDHRPQKMKADFDLGLESLFLLLPAFLPPRMEL